ncbi:MAG TPA: GAF domain-containing protein, partial [Nitrolancea sp.]|nr:GAF domain-containing protein [Nitrolancea sp.]
MSRSVREDLSDASDRRDLADRLRLAIPAVISSIMPGFKEISEAFRRPPEDVIVGIVEDYIGSLADSIGCGTFEPMEAYLERVDPHWAPSGLGVSHVMHGLFMINDACWDAVKRPGEDPEPFQWWSREAMRMVTEGSVSAINRKLAGELERHRIIEERLVSLQRVSATVLSEVDLESMLQTIVDEAMKLIGANASAIRLVDRESTNLRVIACAGERDSLLSHDALPVHGSLAGYSFRSGEPVISNNIAEDPRISPELRAVSKLRSLMIVPLIVRDAAIGALLVSDRLRGPFTQEDQRLLSLFADQAATAIEHAQLYQQAQHQIAELAALHRISNVISSSLEIEDVFMAIYHEIRQVMT